MHTTDIVGRFEDEFKNRSNFHIVDVLITETFVHHLSVS